MNASTLAELATVLAVGGGGLWKLVRGLSAIVRALEHVAELGEKVDGIAERFAESAEELRAWRTATEQRLTALESGRAPAGAGA